MDSTMKMAEGQHIHVIYNSFTRFWKDMVMQHYDLPEYDNTLIFSFPLPSATPELDDMKMGVVGMEIKPNQRLQHLADAGTILIIDLDEYRGQYSKIIWYDLERPFPVPYPYHQAPYIFERVDEVWIPWIESLAQYPREYRDKYVFKPMRYLEGMFDMTPNDNPKWDMGFIGAPAPWGCDYRVRVMQALFDSVKHWYYEDKLISEEKYRYWHAGGVDVEDMKDMIKNTKFMIDLPSDDFKFYSQNVLRLNELVSAGVPCVSCSGQFNYFPGVVDFGESSNPMEVINRKVFEEVRRDVKNKWKRMTDKDEDYSSYINHLLKNYEETNGDIWITTVV